MLASSPEVSDRPTGPALKLPSHIVPQPGAPLVFGVDPVVTGHPSAALNVLFDHHAAVSEERAGQRLQESPGVGARVEGLHVAERWTLAAHDAPCGVDLPVQDHRAAQKESQDCN